MAKWKRTVILAALCALLSQAAMGQEWRARMEASLARKASYDFREMAFADVIKMLATDAKINIILDSNMGGVAPTQKITLKLTRMSYSDILTWITRLSGLNWCIKDEAVFVAPFQRFAAAAKEQIKARNLAQHKNAAKTWLPGFKKILERQVSLQFDNKPLGDCCKTLEGILEVNIILSTDVDPHTRVDLAVSKMKAENLLAWVARKAGIDYAVLDEAVYFAPTAWIRSLRDAGLDLSSRGRAYDLVSFDFTDTPLNEAIGYLSKQTGLEIVLRDAPEKMPTVTLARSNMTLMAALQAITRSTGANSAIVSEGRTIVVSIMKSAPAAPKAPLQQSPGGDKSLEPVADEPGGAPSEDITPEDKGGAEPEASQDGKRRI